MDLMSHRWIEENMPDPVRDDRAEALTKWFAEERLRLTTQIHKMGDQFTVKLTVWEPQSGVHICFVADSYTKEQLIANKWRGSLLHRAYKKLLDANSR